MIAAAGTVGLDTTIVDRVYRYGELADPTDRFSELRGPTAPLVVDEPAAFPQLPGALNAILGGACAELPQRADAFQVRVQVSADVLAAGGADAPVLLVVPGGGFLSGTANSRWFSMPEYVLAGYVVMSVNYRVGALGHLGPSGELAESQRGLRDLMTALRWIHEHAAQFGANANNITLVGDSAGAWYGYALATMIEAKGLFQRLMLVSMPWGPPLDGAGYTARRKVFLDALEAGKAVHATDSEKVRGASIAQLLQAQRATVQAFAGKGTPLLPVAVGPLDVDLHNYPVSASRLHVRDLALISTTEEAAGFLFAVPDADVSQQMAVDAVSVKFDNPREVMAWTNAKWGDPTPKQRLIEALTLYEFRTAHLELARAATAAGVRVSLASFSVRSRLKGAYSPHCFILPFLFNGAEQWFDAPMLEGFDRDEVARLGTQLKSWLCAFAKQGVERPFDEASPLRLEFDGDKPALIEIVEACCQARR